ncbi:bifunctional 3'-5' exonuclease/DNA polymerase [Frigoribacterium sp. 2-23]|uniref:bifunctional 3'-5' exonuclease/DNA polymerase n=1 Tax=Frigoribacterium sp. 2-23 TaxID=3415006 RepID=UPI003C6F0804
MFRVVRRLPSNDVEWTDFDRVTPTARLTAQRSGRIEAGDVADEIGRVEAETRPRWVWDDTPRWYPRLLGAGVRVSRIVDLRLVHALLRSSSATEGSALHGAARGPWDTAQAATDDASALFELVPESLPDPVAEFLAQREAIEASPARAGLELLVAAESTGALVAVEMRRRGIPWSPIVHDAVLTELLGPRPGPGERPAHMRDDLDEIRVALGDPDVNPDSPVELRKALNRAGIPVTSTSKWQLSEHEHPVIEPLLRYKKRQRLLVANGWSWLDAWIRDGRFRPDYVPGGVVTGRWATSGGGALQLPKAVRRAVVADPGWKLVVADAAQLEPRILSGLARDAAMAKAGEGDLYEGIVRSGAVADRPQAKVAMLGAMYGATRGESGRLVPRLARAFPRAMAYVDAAAAVGEGGGVVSTLLGRSSPRPGAGVAPDVMPPEMPRADGDGASRAWGRFTRNFVVQGTAAEWALCWMAALRRRLYDTWGERGEAAPHLVLFLHDELVVHSPADVADLVAEQVRLAAVEAGELLFGPSPVRFPLTVAVVDDYGQAK